MTIEVATGDMPADEARDRIARVRTHVLAAWDDLIALWARRAWVALGHPSWDALCDAELGGARIALPRQERREVVGRMRGAGMSTRAIGNAIGVDQATVVRDMSSGDADASPAPVGNPTPETPGPGDVPPSSHPARDTTTGLDGKVYPLRPRAPRTPPPLPSADEQVAEVEQGDASALARALMNLGCITPKTRDRWARVWRERGVGTPREVLLGDAGLSRDVIDKARDGLDQLQKGLGL